MTVENTGKRNLNWYPNVIKNELSKGVLSVMLSARSQYFKSYSSGILNNTNCPLHTDHAVAMVGWGADATTGQEYWIVRNSWGSNWGEAGYIRMAIDESGPGICGVQKSITTVTMA